MSYSRSDTEVIPEEDPIIKHYKRVHMCVAACEGIDESMLDLLSKKSKDGITNLQHILNKVTWTGLPTQQ